MTIPHDRWLLDTNIWVFGLRRSAEFPACAELLDRIGSFSILIPLQLLKELNVNLSEDEMRYLYELINQYPDIIEINWNEHQPIEYSSSRNKDVERAMR